MGPLIGHLRHRERQMMDSTITVGAGGGEPYQAVYNPSTNEIECEPGDTLVGNMCYPPSDPVPALIRPTYRAGQSVEYGGQEVDLSTLEIRLAADVPVSVGDPVEVTTSPDPALVGIGGTVHTVFTDDLIVNRRILVEIIT